MSKYYEEYPKYDKCCYDKCCCNRCCCDCSKIAEAVKDAIFLSGKARLNIETIFDYEDPCDNLNVLNKFYEDAAEKVKNLICVLRYLSKNFDKDCFYCEYDAAFAIQRAIRDTEVVQYHWIALGELVNECNCECVLCEALTLITVSFERIAAASVWIASINKMLKEKEDPCKKDCY